MLSLAIVTIACATSADVVVPEETSGVVTTQPAGKAPLNDKAEESSGIVTTLPAGSIPMDDKGRVTHDAFVEYFKEAHKTELTETPTSQAHYNKYLEHLWTLSLSMNNSPSEDTLGPRHFKYAAIEAGSFYFNGHSAPSMPPAFSETRDMAMADRDWQKVDKDSEGRVTRVRFTKFFEKKHRHQANRKEEYHKFIDALFELALEMMLPASESEMGFFTLGKHCFKSAAVMAEQYYVQGRMPHYVEHPIAPPSPPDTNEFHHPVGHPYNEAHQELVRAL